jgi:hypothetical protein
MFQIKETDVVAARVNVNYRFIIFPVIFSTLAQNVAFFVNLQALFYFYHCDDK